MNKRTLVEQLSIETPLRQKTWPFEVDRVEDGFCPVCQMPDNLHVVKIVTDSSDKSKWLTMECSCGAEWLIHMKWDILNMQITKR